MAQDGGSVGNRAPLAIGRRTFMLGASALLLPGRLAAAPPDPALVLALREHLDFATGFRTKFQTGFFHVARKAGTAEALEAAAAIPSRLTALSNQYPTLLLVHAMDGEGHLQGWLFDGSGLIATGRTGAPYAGLDPVRAAIGVDARTATRAPVPKRAAMQVTPPAESSPRPSPGPALAEAAANLFPGDIGKALAAGNGRLLVLSARDTASAPWAALPLPGGAAMVERWTVMILPDLQTMLDPQRVYDVARIDWSRALVVGDPDLRDDPDYFWKRLPGARREAASVAGMMNVAPDHLLIDRQATRNAVIDQLTTGLPTNLVYLASHGLANSVNPMDGSFIALGGGHLYGRDLRSPKFNRWGRTHPLVVLSACQTALGKTFGGGAYGMARAFVQAGAAQVVASLWNVSDPATEQMMQVFTDKLEIGLTPERALRSAQRETAKSYAGDPGAWASFTVMGMPAVGQA